MKNMTLWNIARACSGRFVIPAGGEALLQKRGLSCPGAGMATIRKAAGLEAKGIVRDSREVQPGFVFVAAVGEKVDGHRFIPQVFEKGAIGVICEKEPEPLPGPCIIVKDSLQAMREAAEFYRQQVPDIPMVGITGSVGKTSTKEFVAAVLSQKYRTHKTEGNYNNEVGVPLTLFAMPEDAQAAVVEMGMNHFWEMHRLSKIVRPDICVITNIGQCHLENLGSRDGILKAKCEIFDFMNPQGKICLNGDDDKLATVRDVNGIRPVRFGFSESNDIYAADIVSRGLFGSSVKIHAAGTVFEAEVPLPGIHMVRNALAAAAVGLQMGLSPEQIAAGIASVRAVRGRSRVVRAGELVLIDDCYNANPVSMKAAIDLLDLAEGRRVAVLGDMLELGEEEAALHAEVGRYAAEHQVDCLLCAGALSASMCRAAQDAGLAEAYHFDTREALTEELSRRLRPGDTVLVKASHSMGFDRIVDLLEAE